MTSTPLAVCPPLVLDFAHSDPTAGGGLQAGLFALVSLGTQPMSVITAVSVQDTSGLVGMLALDAEGFVDQARALLEDVRAAAFRVGFLGGVEQVTALAAILADYDDVPLVLCPSLTRMLRDDALEDEVFEALYDLLLPQASLLVIDVADAPRLMGEIEDDDDGDGDVDPQVGEPAPNAMALLAARILDTGCAAVLLTGVGPEHAGTEAGPGTRSNLLFADGALRFTHRWSQRPDACHGAGDTLTAALTAGLACTEDLVETARNAHEYTARALAAGFRPGMGRMLPDRLFWARTDDAAEAAADDADDDR